MKVFAVLISFCIFAYGFSIPESDFLSAITVKNCGISHYRYRPVIVGGYHARHGSFPWMVSLREKDEFQKMKHICGGSILNENWIVTAAHCTKYPKIPVMYEVVVGLHKLSKKYAANVQRRKIAEIVVHKDYDKKTFNNDIALLRTTKPIDIVGSKGYVNGICLPRSQKDPKGYARIIGWGYTKEYGENSDILKEVAIPLIPRFLCLDVYDEFPYDGFDEITENMICAGLTKKDSCQNDSGGPLFRTNSKGVSTLIGIISFGNGCGRRGYPGVYTKVSMYRDWMKKVILK